MATYEGVHTPSVWDQDTSLHVGTSDSFSDERNAAADAKQRGDEWRAKLARTVEREIVPRLLLAATAEEATTPRAIASSSAHAIDHDDVLEFSRLVLVHEVEVAAAFIEALRTQGTSLDDICLDLLAPAARYLGVLWEEDECDFTEVTLALCRLHQLIGDLGLGTEGRAIKREHAPRALLLAAPGEQHTFGLRMVTEFFRRAGWDVWDEPIATNEMLLEAVSSEWYDVVGMSISCDTRLDSLGCEIRDIRRASRNQSVRVMVGGPTFLAHPERAALVGADATAVDGRQAAVLADRILGLLPRDG